MNFQKGSNRNIKYSLLLILTALIWGFAFVAQSVSMEYIEPFTFNCIRSIMGGIVLLPLMAVLDLKNKQQLTRQSASANLNKAPDMSEESNKFFTKNRKTLLLAGLLCGTALFIASNLQQIGIMYTTVGKAGFITALYIVMVPILGLFFKKKVRGFVWIGVILSVIGLYLLCMSEGFSFGRGDFLLLLCAFFFSIQILIVDYYSPKVDGVKLSCIEFFVCGILSGVCMFLFETPSLNQIWMTKIPLLYAGVLSCGVGYTLQIIGQQKVNPTVASLLLSLESVFSALAGFLILGQTLSGRELAGCILMFVAIVLAQL